MIEFFLKPQIVDEISLKRIALTRLNSLHLRPSALPDRPEFDLLSSTCISLL